MSISTKRALSFDTVADIYKNIRPGYPSVIYDKLKIYLDTSKTLNFLEIGSGHGVATKEVNNNFNCNIIALEPGEKLCEMTKVELQNNKNIKFINTTFEEYSDNQEFDCIYSATAFHWIDKNIKFKKTYEYLKDDGVLFLYWNNYSVTDEKIFDDIQDIYLNYHPDVTEKLDNKSYHKNLIEKRKLEIEKSGYFENIYNESVITIYKFSSSDYVLLLKSFSNNSTKKAGELDKFYFEIEKLIDSYGGYINLPINTNFNICKKIK